MAGKEKLNSKDKIAEPEKKAEECEQQSETKEIEFMDSDGVVKKKKNRLKEFWRLALIVMIIGSTGVFAHLVQQHEFPDSISIVRLLSACLIISGLLSIIILSCKSLDKSKKTKSKPPKCRKTKREDISEAIYFMMLQMAAAIILYLLPERPDMWKYMIPDILSFPVQGKSGYEVSNKKEL